MERFTSLQRRLQAALPTLKLRVQEPMCRHTSFQVGGPAALMACPTSCEALSMVVRLAREAGVQPFFLGKGSNLLVADEGVDAFLIKLAGGLTTLTREGETALRVGAGVSLAQAAVFAAEHGLTGLEFAHGIPGTLGGGVFMNAGAYGGEMVQVIRWADCLDEAGQLHRLTRDELDLGYRTSIFTHRPWVIVEAGLSLQKGDRREIRAKMAELARSRRSKQPLEYPSAGSTFKRPQGHFAGALIEQCGLKGCQIGMARVSEKHAGFVVNLGGATSRDIRALVSLVQKTVREQTGVTLEPEIRLLGCTWEET